MRAGNITQYESRLRSLVKAISWRVIATLTTMLITWWVTANVNAAMLVGSVEFTNLTDTSQLYLGLFFAI